MIINEPLTFLMRPPATGSTWMTRPSFLWKALLSTVAAGQRPTGSNGETLDSKPLLL